MQKHPWVDAERRFYKKYFKELTKDFNPSPRPSIIDYGTGTGGFASLLAENYPHLKIKAVDSNPEAIELARKHYSHLSNLKFKVAKEVPEGKYDWIFYNLVLHELNGTGDPKTINLHLKRAYKNLNPGGNVSILDNQKIPKTNYQKLWEKNKDPRKKSFEEEYLEHNRYTMIDWKRMLEKAGLNTERHKPIQPNLFIYRGVKR